MKVIDKKKIVFIPPNGEFKTQDFSLHRLARWLYGVTEIETTLIYIKSTKQEPIEKMFDNVIQVSHKDEIIASLKVLPYDIIFNRSWMHSYVFSKKIVQEFDNVVVNIKDWNFSSKEEYEFLFNNSDDFEAMEYIFKNSKYILSHYTSEQYNIWSEEYGISKSKFIFFPEYCNEDTFIDKELIYKDIKIAYAGKIHKSIYPEQCFPAKSHLRSIKKLTKKDIDIDFILPEKEYAKVLFDKNTFMDFLYEDKFNQRFNLLKGDILNPEVLKDYHFGFFELETSGDNKSLYEYAIVSKFAFYLEACIPILVNKDFISIANLVSANGLGIVFDNDDMNNFKDILKISQKEYDQFITSIKLYRKTFTYEVNKKTINRVLER